VDEFHLYVIFGKCNSIYAVREFVRMDWFGIVRLVWRKNLKEWEEVRRKEMECSYNGKVRFL
jgi:hypothetical protein